jgi:hypothetical protein
MNKDYTNKPKPDSKTLRIEGNKLLIIFVIGGIFLLVLAKHAFNSEYISKYIDENIHSIMRFLAPAVIIFLGGITIWSFLDPKKFSLHTRLGFGNLHNSAELSVSPRKVAIYKGSSKNPTFYLFEIEPGKTLLFHDYYLSHKPKQGEFPTNDFTIMDIYRSQQIDHIEIRGNYLAPSEILPAIDLKRWDNGNDILLTNEIIDKDFSTMQNILNNYTKAK